MALKKNRTTKHGANAEYSRLEDFHQDRSEQDAVFTIALYKDKAARDGGKASFESPMVNLGEIFHALEYPGEADTMERIIYRQGYLALKQQAAIEAAKDDTDLSKQHNIAFFADAEDV